MKLKVVKIKDTFYMLVGVRKWFKVNWYQLCFGCGHKVMFRTKTQAMSWARANADLKLSETQYRLGARVDRDTYFDEICR